MKFMELNKAMSELLLQIEDDKWSIYLIFIDLSYEINESNDR